MIKKFTTFFFQQIRSLSRNLSTLLPLCMFNQMRELSGIDSVNKTSRRPECTGAKPSYSLTKY